MADLSMLENKVFGVKKFLRAPLSTVLYCAHGNKEETKISHLSSEESFGVFINFTSREKGCGKSDPVRAEIQCSQKKG